MRNLRLLVPAVGILALAAPARAQQDVSLQPGPGKVPLIVESVGAPQIVGLVTGSMAFVGYGGYGVAVLQRNLCTTPCTLYAPPGFLPLRTGGNGVRTVSTDLNVPPGGMRVRMRAPSLGRFIGGFIMTGIGGGMILAGATTMAMASFETTTTFNPGTGMLETTDTGLRSGFLIGGGIVTALGAGLLAGGIALLATNRSGPVSIEPLNAAPGPAPPPAEVPQPVMAPQVRARTAPPQWALSAAPILDQGGTHGGLVLGALRF